ncbi:MAG: hypothetical protein V7L29_19595 [Nostoc sp.]
MILPDLKSQIYKLSVSEHLELLGAITYFLQNDLRLHLDRKGAAHIDKH